MIYTTLDELKTHLKMDDISEDDAYLEKIGEAAEAHAISLIQWTEEQLTYISARETALLSLLTLQIAGDMYAQREASTPQELKLTPLAQSLVARLRHIGW